MAAVAPMVPVYKTSDPSCPLPIPFPHALFNPVTNIFLILAFSYPNLYTKAAFFVLVIWWFLSCYYNFTGVWMTDYFDSQNAAMVMCRGTGMLLCMDPTTFKKKAEIDVQNGNAVESKRNRNGQHGLMNGNTNGVKEKRVRFDQDKPSVLDKVRRGAGIFVAYRGFGWSFEVNGIPPSKPRDYSRTRFVLENIVKIVVQLLVVDVAMAWIRGYTTIGERPVQPTLYDSPLMLRLVYASIIGLNLRTLFNVFCLVLATITVAAGLYEPADWPPMFASLWEGYSVRRFWSYVWHQLMRLNFEAMARFGAYNILGIKRETRFGREAKGLIVFFLSGVCHAFGSISTDGASYGEVRFFGSQFLAIILEETILSRLAYRPGTKQDKPILRLIGYLWTAFWVLTGLVGWLNRMRSEGVAMEDQVNLGIGDLLLRNLLDK